MVVLGGTGVPLGDHLHSASPGGSPARGDDAGGHPGKTTYHAGRPWQKPVRVIADKAYDSDPCLALVSVPLDCRAHDRLVGKLAASGRTLRSLGANPAGFFSHRLIHASYGGLCNSL
jgi:hypothetical protein